MVFSGKNIGKTTTCPGGLLKRKRSWGGPPFPLLFRCKKNDNFFCRKNINHPKDVEQKKTSIFFEEKTSTSQDVDNFGISFEVPRGETLSWSTPVCWRCYCGNLGRLSCPGAIHGERRSWGKFHTTSPQMVV